MQTSLKNFFASIDINTDILEPLHSGIAILTVTQLWYSQIVHITSGKKRTMFEHGVPF